MRSLLFMLLLFTTTVWGQTYQEKVTKSKALFGKPVQLNGFYTLAKQPITFENLKGEPVVAYFFASWCSPCYESLGNLNQAIDISQPSVNVIAISLDESWEDLEMMLDKTGFSGEVWKWAEEESALKQRLFGNFSGSLPYVIKINAQGILEVGSSRIKTVTQWSAVINNQASLSEANRL